MGGAGLGVQHGLEHPVPEEAVEVKGVALQKGQGEDLVGVIQQQLNAISQNYPAIPKVAVDGIFGEGTKAAVQKFQSVFNMPVSGIVDYPTWYKLSAIYVAVTRIGELYQ